MNKAREKLLISDVDEVIAVKEVPIGEVVDSFEQFASRGHGTTIATGRNFRRLMGFLGPHFSKIVTPEFLGKPNLLVVDNGGTVMKADGTGFHAFPIGNELKKGIVEALDDADLTFAAFDPDPYNPGDPEMWVFQPEKINSELLERYRRNYRVEVSASRLPFIRRFLETTASNLATQLESTTIDRTKIPEGIVSTRNRGVVDFHVSGKDRGVDVLREYFGLPDLSSFIYAGDGWGMVEDALGNKVPEHDRAVFLRPDLGGRIVVTSSLTTDLPHQHTIVENPSKLAEHLSTYR